MGDTTQGKGQSVDRITKSIEQREAEKKDLEKQLAHLKKHNIKKTFLMGEKADFDGTMKLIEQYGFPTWKLVGEQGSTNAWLIAQHSPEYIHWYLKQYRKAVEDNNAGRQELAYMEDRILAMECRPQIYGTQL